ncbi:uncharacterized protein MONOS_8255 [Monocercomonoides exilis]|uniref:uncharacterized protein n=1 Tax=Monocercomonoides exilis TaxID=2049356 RepID=UPI003559CA98|nr:hypothetical protein MONOS_8255 [Monocercomonoides exilis]|eukprot:MONOS_8255.1-p1 / transcript=MONOS_8255.1 / gene=MONOS_8255 / organism=Monocercomonoides_exilis_PA203 / gene_product=unspecified product / transcript_product=unspecified product / location=Mono_scaffold00307:5747-8893(-) / protein_length=932 / sequence_SO=supercontig / SO=protein_coding / is_pseudo=false
MKQDDLNVTTKNIEDLMNPRIGHTFVNCVEGALLAGGTFNGNFLDDVWFFDYDSQTFVEKPKLPIPLTKHACATTTDGEVAIIWGGKTKSTEQNAKEIESFEMFVATKNSNYTFKKVHISSNEVLPPHTMTELTFWFSYKNKHIFILSGGIFNENSNPTSLYKLILSKEGQTYSAVFERMFSRPEGLYSRRKHFAAIFGSSLYLFGGNSASSLIEKYNLADNTFFRLSSPLGINPPPLMDFASCCLPNGSFVVFGGYDMSDSTMNVLNGQMFRYDIDPCYESIDCKSCVLRKMCSWCSTKHTCVSMSLETGKAIYEPCTQLMHTEGQCPSECEESIDCVSCLRHKGCGWCQNTFSSPEHFAGCLPGNILGPTLGSCGSWAYGNDSAVEECANIRLNFEAFVDSSSNYLAASEQYFIKWSFDPAAFGYIDVFAVVKEANKTIEDFYSVQYNVPVDNPWLHAVIPAVGEGATMKFRFFVHSHGAPHAYMFYDSENYAIITPKMKVLSPGKGETLYGTVSQKIKFERGGFERDVSVTLHHLSNLNHPVKTIAFSTMDSEVTWDDMEDVSSADDYVICISSSATGVLFTISEVFSFRSDNIELELESPTAQTIIETGELITIKWKCNNRAGPMQIALYVVNSKNESERVQILSDNQNPHENFEWEAIVNESSERYIFCVEEIVTGTKVCSSEKTIKAPSLDVKYVSLRSPERKRDKGSGGLNLVEGEEVNITWEYAGKKSRKTILLYNESSMLTIGITKVDENATYYKWTVPIGMRIEKVESSFKQSITSSVNSMFQFISNLNISQRLFSFTHFDAFSFSSFIRNSSTSFPPSNSFTQPLHNSLHLPRYASSPNTLADKTDADKSVFYRIYVEAEWRSINASTSPFLIMCAGEMPVQSIGSVAALSAIALVLIVCLFFLWCFHFRKYNIGFNPLS